MKKLNENIDFIILYFISINRYLNIFNNKSLETITTPWKYLFTIKVGDFPLKYFSSLDYKTLILFNIDNGLGE